MKGLSKNRYLELKYFSLQYSELKKKRNQEIARGRILEKQTEFSDPVGNNATLIALYSSKIELIEMCCFMAGGDISDWLFMAVTEGMSFNTLKMQKSLPCERDMFYRRRRQYYMFLNNLL